MIVICDKHINTKNKKQHIITIFTIIRSLLKLYSYLFKSICDCLSLDSLSAIEYTISMQQKFIKIAQLSNGKTPFIDWIESLDKVTKSRVQSRLTRLLENNFGDHKKIDNDISELRLKFGSGYRIYYTEIDNVIVLLINGGDKSTQSKDIQKAKDILQEWRNIQ